MSKHHRRALFIDRPVQVAVLSRVMLYWALCAIAQILMVLFFAVVTSSQQAFINYGPQLWWHLQLSLIASAVLLPIILMDVLKLSHRWVGPIFRLRASLKALSRGEAVAEVRFRDGDFWQELAGDLNAVAAEIERHKAVATEEPGIGSASPNVAIAAESQRATDRPSTAIAP
jgi:hypothetical protein